MLKASLITVIMLFSFPLLSQDCDCKASFDWLVETFETNDAGFAYAISQKGEQTYKRHNEAIKTLVENALNEEECASVMQEWLSFFRSGHIGLQYMGDNPAPENEKLNDDAIRAKFADWQRKSFDLEAFKTYLDNKTTIDYEGIWVSGVYEIGIQKVEDKYIGFIINADGVYWLPEQVKLEIKEENGKQEAVYYMQDHSAEKFDEVALIGDNYLKMGFIDLSRSYPEIQVDPALERYIKIVNTEKPYFEQLNDQTTYIRIPSFGRPSKKLIDKVIKKNEKAIKSSENLIIDIRGNGGGSDESYYELLPFLYTNPIRTVGVEYLSTPLNNQRMLDFINNPEFEFTDEEKEWAQSAYDKLSAQEGAFVNLDSTVVDIYSLTETLPQPSRVAILIDKDNGSTAEQFLLAANQSQKVKLYGETTYGVLDISNMYWADSPCQNYKLYYCLTRSMCIPGMEIDEKGIQPDYHIDRSIENHQWIQFVLNSWGL